MLGSASRPSATFNKRKAEAPEQRERWPRRSAIVGERLRPVYVLLDGERGAARGARPPSEDELDER